MMTITTARQDAPRLTRRLAFRLTAEDLGHVAAIAAALRATTGDAFPSRSAVLRVALKTTVEAMTGGGNGL